MTIKQLTWAEVGLEDPEARATVQKWLARGDGIAVYQNEEFGHPEFGHRQFLSFGSPAAMLEADDPPEQMPDFTDAINWRYRLVGVHWEPKEGE